MTTKKTLTIVGVALVLAVGLLTFLAPEARTEDQPYGGEGDVAFAEKLWKAMDGYPEWKLTTDLYEGRSPHGKWVRLFSTWVTVDDEHYPIIVKDNYGGRGVTRERIAEDRTKWLKSVTIMLQREPGYDPEHQSWFYVAYGPDGKVRQDGDGRAQAGRVAKGCISCHAQARDDDYLFSND